MRLAILSDLHLGDPQCGLVQTLPDGTFELGDQYPAFLNALKEIGLPLDYLILNGDVMEFTLAGYSTAYRAARLFFTQLQHDGVTRTVIYIPGNHDFDLWHTVEYEVNIIGRLHRGHAPRPFRWSVPGILDARSSSSSDLDIEHEPFRLPNVDERHDPDDPHRYGGLFMDFLPDHEGEDTAISFYFAYPNLYLLTDEQSILVTHGHYFENMWSFMGEWLLKVAGEDMGVGISLTLNQYVALNYPQAHFMSASVGQAGVFTDRIIQILNKDIKDRDMQRLGRYMDRFRTAIDRDEIWHKIPPFRRWVFSMALRLAKPILLRNIRKMREGRYVRDFLSDRTVRNRFLDYYQATIHEIEALRREIGCDIELPTTAVFGHTHVSIPWGSTDAPRVDVPQLPNGPVTFYNTGGWLYHTNMAGDTVFGGAAIIGYNDEIGQPTFRPHIIPGA